MNCKPGDLAVVVRSMAGNEGKIVRCLRLIPTVLRKPTGDWQHVIWEVDQELRSWSGDSDRFIADEQLRPIRDPGDDAQDETLSWLPVPSTEKEAA